MAEEINSYLQYNDGFVLHNGLPVKWVTAASAITKWEDFDLIIERVGGGVYKGVTVPYRYSAMSGFPNYTSPVPADTMSNATARYGYEIANVSGDIKLKTNKYMSCNVIHNPNGPWPTEGLSGKRDNYGYEYPSAAGDSYFIGIKFANDYGVPNYPDLTNYGSGGSAYSVIHKLRAPNSTLFQCMVNASNYTAMKNVYMPSGSLYNAGINGSAPPSMASKRQCVLFENIYMPNGWLDNNDSSSGSWSANHISNASAIDVTAKLVRVPSLTGSGISAQILDFSGGEISSSTASEVYPCGGSVYNSTFSGIRPDTYTTGTFVNCNFTGANMRTCEGTFTNCYFKDVTAGNGTVGRRKERYLHCSADNFTWGVATLSATDFIFDYVNNLKLTNGDYNSMKNTNFAVTANTATILAKSAVGTISAATNAGVLVRDSSYASKFTAYDCKPNSWLCRQGQQSTWSANVLYYKDDIGTQIGQGVLHGNKKIYASGGNTITGAGNYSYFSADLRNVNFNGADSSQLVTLYSGTFILTSAQYSAYRFIARTAYPQYSTIRLSG